jgi:hypothetical protein
MSYTDFHGAAHALDPEYHSHPFDAAGEVDTSLDNVIQKLLNEADAAKALAQYHDYKHQQQAFVPINAHLKAAADMPAWKWWAVYGKRAPELRRVAMRVLACTAVSSSCERNWSTFEFIHSRKRNKLTPARCNNLVYVFSTMQLLRRQQWLAERRRMHPTIPWEMYDSCSEESEVEEDLGAPASRSRAAAAAELVVINDNDSNDDDDFEEVTTDVP